MKFQPGQSGNPAGRPPGSLNKNTLALEAAFAARAEHILNDVMDAAKKGDKDARRMCMERILPRKRDRAVAIDLPVIRTPEDAEEALAVVTAELAAGHLTISDATALVALVERMLRVAERMWAFARARRRGAVWDAVTLDDVEASVAGREPARTVDPEAAQTADKAGASLYSPVNSQIPSGAGGAERVPSGQPATHLDVSGPQGSAGLAKAA